MHARIEVGVLVENAPVRRDHVGRAVGVFRLVRQDGVIGRHDLLILIGGHRKLAAALADRELAQRRDVVAADADDAGPQGRVLVDRLGEFVRLEGAPGREGRRIEVENHRPLLEGFGEREAELLAAERGLRHEVRRHGPGLQGRRSGKGEGGRGDKGEELGASSGEPHCVGFIWTRTC